MAEYFNPDLVFQHQITITRAFQRYHSEFDTQITHSGRFRTNAHQKEQIVGCKRYKFLPIKFLGEKWGGKEEEEKLPAGLTLVPLSRSVNLSNSDDIPNWKEKRTVLWGFNPPTPPPLSPFYLSHSLRGAGGGGLLWICDQVSENQTEDPSFAPPSTMDGGGCTRKVVESLSDTHTHTHSHTRSVCLEERK